MRCRRCNVPGESRAAKGGAAIALALSLLAISPAYGTEEIFTYIDEMPTIEGTLQSVDSREDRPSGLTFVKRVYRALKDDHALLTHVLEASCAKESETGSSPSPYIIALQYLPKSPKSYLHGEVPGLFREVCVRDLTGSIRVYENIGAREMVELTHRFQPLCPAV